MSEQGPPAEAMRAEKDMLPGLQLPSLLWEYKLHEEMVFYHRLNYFLVAESMLFVAFATIAVSDSGEMLSASLGVLGAVLSLLWLFVGHRQLRVMAHVSELCRERFADYAVLRSSRRAARVSSTVVLTYAVPALVLLTWFLALLLT